MSSVHSMSSPTPGGKKRLRPPPITIPSQAPPRPIPGPNAFALAERTEQEEAARQAGNAFYQQGRRSTTQTPVTSPLEDSYLPQPASHTSKDRHRVSVIEHAKLFISGMSPRKAEAPAATPSRHVSNVSTTRSRHSERSLRSQRSVKSGHPPEDSAITSRYEIEGRNEKRFFKMMGTEPSERPDTVTIHVQDLTLLGAKKKPIEPTKSPKKKIFGVSIPNFKSSFTPPNVEPTPPMPSKAAQVLGASPASKQRVPPSFKTPRSDTSKSLPVKMRDQQSRGRRHNNTDSAQIRQRAPARSLRSRTPVRGVTWQGIDVTSKSSGPLDLGVPPTPPQKDTPPDVIDKENNVGGLFDPAYLCPRPDAEQDDEAHEDRDVFVDGGMTLQVPRFPTDAKVIPDNGGEDPVKFTPYGAQDYVKLIEGYRVGSTHAEYDYAGVVANGNHSAPLAEKEMRELLNMPGQGRWAEENHARYRSELAKRLSGQAVPVTLPPTFYSPPTYSISLLDAKSGFRPSKNTDYNRLLFTVPPHPTSTNTTTSRTHSGSGDIGVIFQVTANDIETFPDMSRMLQAAGRKGASPNKSQEAGQARVSMQELQGNDEPGSGRSQDNTYLLPEHSSSKLTDILNGVSPSKAGFGQDFYPNCPSAVPSPLHRMPGQQLPGEQIPDQQAPNQQQMPHPMMMGLTPGPLGYTPTLDPLEHHIRMTNEHIDVSGRTLYDFVEKNTHDTIAAVRTEHGDTVAVLSQRFEEIKSRLAEFNLDVARVAEQTHGVNAKLDNLFDFIKKEIVESMTIHAKKMTDMESSIKALQKSMFDIEQSVETKSNPTPGPATFQQYPLPHQRSQPSLVGFYDTHSEPPRDGHSHLPAIQENRNDGRFQYGFNNNHSWNRPPPAARTNNKEAAHPFPNINPYANGASNFGGGYTGGYSGSSNTWHT